MTASLELRDVHCIRGGRSLFRHLDFSIAPGQLLRVKGANGAGKTSLLRLACGLLAPAGGSVLWNGSNISALREEFTSQLAYIGHAAALKDDLSSIENLRTATILGGGSPGHEDILAALDAAGLRRRERLPVRFLSQGQRRRAALARLMLCRQTPLWVLDEPFNALDTGAVNWLRGLIADHLDQHGMVMLTNHQDLPIVGSGSQTTISL